MSDLPRVSVSVAICCHNAGARLAPVLEHLQAQRVSPGLVWEVIVIDNASSDDTSSVALGTWALHPLAPIRLVREPKLGLRYAREKALEEAACEVISFVDDDNWVSPDWIDTVSKLMGHHPRIGALGGRTEAVTGVSLPTWFDRYRTGYAVGPQHERDGDVTWPLGHLWGAGLSIRRKAWQELRSRGFKPLLTGRTGRSLSSGEDYELCYALRLAGWTIWYSSALTLQHRIPESRLTEAYLKRLRRSFGEQTIGHDPYEYYVRCDRSGERTLIGRVWLYEAARALHRGLIRERVLWTALIPRREPSLHQQLRREYLIGRLSALLRTRNRYDESVRSIGSAGWVQVDRPTACDLHARFSAGLCSFNTFSENTPLVSVVICNYNYGRFIATAIDSALAQTWPKLEIIVVDDGSTDDSREILTLYKDRVRLIFKNNGGQASAFNAGVAVASGEIICFLDSDDVWMPDKVSQVVDAFRSGPWSIVSHHLEDIDIDGNAIDPERLGYARKVLPQQALSIQEVASKNYPWVFAPTSGLSVLGSVAKKITPLPESNWRICADVPIAYGSLCHGPHGVLRKRLAKYRYHGRNGFASTRLDGDQAAIVGTLQRLKRHTFIDNYISTRSDVSVSREESVNQYPFFMECCLIASSAPLTHIRQLWQGARLYYRSHRLSSFPIIPTGSLKVLRDLSLLLITGLGLTRKYRVRRGLIRRHPDFTSADVQAALGHILEFRR